MKRCGREHLLVAVSTEDGETFVHVFESDARECERLGGMMCPPSDKDT